MGHHNRHFGGDRYAQWGAWSPPTSTANFCEEDYVVTKYLAEYINALTNLIYVYFAVRYMYGPGSRGLFTPRWDFMSIALLVLGVCSFLFHASLRHAMQFADEFAMLGLVWSLLQGVLVGQSSLARDRFVNASLAIVFPVFCVFYAWTGKIIYHVSVFALALILLTLRGFYLFLWRQPGFPESKCAGWRRRGWTALGLLIVGYILWNVDLEFCAELRSVREHIGLPWAWLLELHGWWHIITGISANIFMDVVREVQEELREEKKDQ